MKSMSSIPIYKPDDSQWVWYNKQDMRTRVKSFRIFTIAITLALAVVVVKQILHTFNLELVAQSSLHNAAISSVIFVLGFILSATIADYKESERIPSDFSTNIEDMYNDAVEIHKTYPVFDLDGFRGQLLKIAQGFGRDARKKSYDARLTIRDLGPYYTEMERGGVPANFIVKLKQQQVLLLRARQRVDYIQRIKFVPSATILARSIVIMVIILLLFTNVDPFYGGLAIVGIISFVLIYMLILIKVISTPFHDAGTTRDDVSLFLIKDAVEYLSKKSSK